MYIKYDLKKDLEDTEIEGIILQRKLKENKEKYEDICELLKRSARFDESLVFVLSELISYKEGIPYSPFSYLVGGLTGFGSIEYLEQIKVGIAPDDVICDYIDNGNYNIYKLFNNKIGYEIFTKTNDFFDNKCKDEIIDFYDFKDTELYPQEISFNFLLKDFNLSNYPSSYDFKEYKYIQDYLNYLFELQLKNNANHLTYDEMNQALDEFLDLEDKKSLLLKQAR